MKRSMRRMSPARSRAYDALRRERESLYESAYRFVRDERVIMEQLTPWERLMREFVGDQDLVAVGDQEKPR